MPPVRTMVFSGWTVYLDLMASAAVSRAADPEDES
jgi:hypothetical protein